MRYGLHRGVSLSVLASARTQADHHQDLGCSIQGPSASAVRRALLPLKRRIAELGKARAHQQARALIRWIEETPRYRALCEGTKRRRGRRVLQDDVIYPAAAGIKPRYLHLRQEGLGLDVRVVDWAAVDDLFATLSHGASRAELAAFERTSATAELVTALREARWLVPHPGALAVPEAGATFIGHNTVLVSSGAARVLVDPYFRPASVVDLPGYQPLRASDLGRIDAVLITHTHGDHFHLGSLLELPRDTALFVPYVPRESLFSTDCVLRLRQVGFTNVMALQWGQRARVGDIDLHALPFHGEQPTCGPGVHEGLFNEGNTWLVSTPGFKAAFFADAGDDGRGDMRSVCRAARERHGDVEVLFCGIRGFSLEPIFFGFTTLEAFLVDVPMDALTTPIRLMADSKEALALGAALGARYVVPCADGGAPWYWREGMGPKYPGYPGTPVEGAGDYDENLAADPYPERLLAEHARRGDAEGPSPWLMRPGEAFAWRAGRPHARTFEGFQWPFEPLSK